MAATQSVNTAGDAGAMCEVRRRRAVSGNVRGSPSTDRKAFHGPRMNKATITRAGKTYSRSGAGGPPHFRGRQGQLLQRAALHLTGEPFGEDWQE